MSTGCFITTTITFTDNPLCFQLSNVACFTPAKDPNQTAIWFIGLEDEFIINEKYDEFVESLTNGRF